MRTLFNEGVRQDWEATLAPFKAEMHRVLVERLKADERRFRLQASVLVRDGYRFSELMIVQKRSSFLPWPYPNVVPKAVIPEKILNRRLFWRDLTNSYFWKKEKELGLL